MYISVESILAGLLSRVGGEGVTPHLSCFELNFIPNLHRVSYNLHPLFTPNPTFNHSSFSTFTTSPLTFIHSSPPTQPSTTLHFQPSPLKPLFPSTTLHPQPSPHHL
ncbi:hypothetical protein M8J77_004601 [Diaphorina citri]|nr:hypothetical protein M8J77_004601 [Diaphorina citri]